MSDPKTFERIQVDPFTIWVYRATLDRNYCYIEYQGDLRGFYNVGYTTKITDSEVCTHINTTLEHPILPLLAELNPSAISERSYETNWGKISVLDWYKSRFSKDIYGVSQSVQKNRFRVASNYEKAVEVAKAYTSDLAKEKLPEALTKATLVANNIIAKWNEEYLSHTKSTLCSNGWQWDSKEIEDQQAEIALLDARLKLKHKELRALKGTEVNKFLDEDTEICPAAKDAARAAIREDQAFHVSPFKSTRY